ncbi:hypothetical protein [Lysinibacillus fusiformis]|uniref:hypothetical protein n=1 Tax=Lysinibacillus fusiformis TaxID=28031 RepID=UPI0035583D20
MSKFKYTDEEIKEYIEDNSECKFIKTFMIKSKYGSKRVLNLECSCGNVFEVLWVKFNRSDGMKQRQCRKCGLKTRGKGQMMTNEEYKRRKKDANIDIEHFENPRGRGVGIRHKCPVCGDENWKPTPANVLAKKSTKCEKCNLKNIAGHNKLTDIDYQKIKKENGINIVNIEKYQDSSTRILHICPDCNKEWNVSPSHVLSKNSERCESCSYIYRSQKRLLSEEEIHQKVEELNCTWISGNYKGNDSLLTFKCECGKNFRKRYSDFRNGWNRCTICMKSLSTGEHAIKKWLEIHNIPFVHQQKFDDLRGKRKMPLSYDFAVYNEQGDIRCLIEYDGAYHFKPMYSFHKDKIIAEKSFEETQTRDKIKTVYAKKMDIPLIRLSGTQYKYLDKHLKHLS